MAIEVYGDEFEYRIEDAQRVHYETRQVCLCSRQSCIAVVRATSAGRRLRTVEPLLDENRDRDEARRNTCGLPPCSAKSHINTAWNT